MNLTKLALKKTNEYSEERANLKNSTKISNIFEYIIEMVDIYSNMKGEFKYESTVEEKKSKESKEINALEIQQESYESLIRKLESDLRNHMKV